jgi:hypothetical protein
MRKLRLQRRALKLWRNDYLTHRYLWRNIEAVVRIALRETGNHHRPIVLDVGCGHKPYRDLFSAAIYIGMDREIVDSSPDFLGDTLCLPIRDQAVDIVFATQVIEHVTKPDQMIRECCVGCVPHGAGYSPIREA